MNHTTPAQRAPWFAMLALLVAFIVGAAASPAAAMPSSQADCPSGTTFAYEYVGSDYMTYCKPDVKSSGGDERGANALALFYFSMGRMADGTAIAEATCLTCDFITHFTTAIANFSAAIFIYFQEFFVILAPLLLACWIAVRVIKLSVAGGEGGGALFSDMVRKLALFFFAWGFLFNGFGLMGPVAPGHGAGNTYFAGPAWHLTGPNLLKYSFDINNDVRSRTAAGLMDMGAGGLDMSPFACTGLDKRISTLVNNVALNPSIQSITQTACVVERMHTLGISTGVALVTSAWNQMSFSPWAMLSSVFKTIWGVLLLAVYGFSAVWLIFLLLDVITKALIVSAFLPLFGLAVLFPRTRDIAVRAVMQFVAVPVVAFALGLTSLLGFFLILGTVETYNATYEMMKVPYSNSTLQPINTTGTVERFAEFIRRIQLPVSDPDTIPAMASSPWLHYLMMVGLGILTLGKKIVTIIENILEVSNTSAMADNAKKMAMMGAAVTMGTATFAAKAAGTAVPIAGAAGVAGIGGGVYMASSVGRGAMGATRQRARQMGASAFRAGAREIGRRVNPFGRSKNE